MRCGLKIRNKKYQKNLPCPPTGGVCPEGVEPVGPGGGATPGRAARAAAEYQRRAGPARKSTETTSRARGRHTQTEATERTGAAEI